VTREELQAIVEVVLGIHAQPDRVDTIMRAADAYATLIARRQRELLEAS
jgi:hypothetical protein